MPGENIHDWSTTAADNDNADTLIDWQEGMPRASVNNSARSVMAAVAKYRNLQNGSITTGGTANAQTFFSGYTPVFTTVPTGMRVLLKIGVTNGPGATTLNMDGIAAVVIKNQSGNNIGAGELTIGSYAEFRYDGANWILLSRRSEFAAGTRIVFFQVTAPIGWTQLTSYNDMALRLVSGTGGNVATWFPFSTQFGLRTSDAHVLTDAEASAGTGIANFSLLMGLAAGGDFASYQVATAGGGAGHAHGLDMRVSYVDVIICTKVDDVALVVAKNTPKVW